MRKLWIFVATILTFFACGPKDEDKQVSIDKEEYKLIIKKEEELGRGYAEGPHMINYKGYFLNEVIVELLDKDPLLVKFRGPKINPEIDIEFSSQTVEKKEAQAIILAELSRFYEFSIEDIKLEKAVWILQLVDAPKLLSHETKSDKRLIRGTQKRNIEWKGTNQNTAELADVIQDKFKVIILNEVDTAKGYDFSIPLVSFDELNGALREDYGMTLEEGREELKMKLISFTPRR